MSSYVALSAVLASTALLACRVDRRPTPNGTVFDAGFDGGRDVPDGEAPDAGEPPSLLDGPPAERISTLTLDADIAGVHLAGEHVIALLATSGLALIDVSDARSPRGSSLMATVGRVVAIRYDHVRQIAFALTESGDLRAFRLTDPSAPVRVGTVALTARMTGTAGASFVDFARVGDRLFVLAGSDVIPVDSTFDAQSGVTMTQRAPVGIGEGALRIAESGSGLFVAFASGIVRSFTATGSPARVDEVSLGGEILAWSVRGERVLVALEGIGVRALWLRPGERADVLLRAGELEDAVLLTRSGQLAAVALGRDRIALLDVSDIERPRGVATYESAPPSWIAVAHGNLLVGDGPMVHVVGVPPFVEAGVAQRSREAAPRNGRITLRFSKPLNPGSITLESVLMRCDGRVVPLIPQLDLERRAVTLLPNDGLPTGAQCAIQLRGVRDELELSATARSELVSFKSNAGIEAPAQNGPSAVPHTAEGRMTGWTARTEDDYEYFDIEPGASASSDLYADYDGERLWLFLDAIELRDALSSDCGVVLSGFTASGDTRFTARIAADQRIQVDGADAVGGYAYGATQGARDPHAAFELAIETAPGGFAIQAYLPSPSRGCEQLDREPVVWSGMCDDAGCTLDGSGAVAEPAMVEDIEPGETADTTPTIRFELPNELMSLPESTIEIATQGEPPRTIFRGTSYATSLAVPSGVLSAGRYDVTITAHNVAGAAPAATSELSIVMPCAHAECLPGVALDASCSSCARDVCEQAASCCASEAPWSDTCVELASERCDCNSPTLASLAPGTGAAGQELAVAVTLADSAPSLEHALVLEPEAEGETLELPCKFEAGAIDTCAVTIPATLPAGSYAASMRISADGATHVTEAIAGAFVLAP
jgi:hypothetical protein